MQDIAESDAGFGGAPVDVWNLLRSGGQLGGAAKVLKK
jgi:hypothetical protein